jgi:hypothetical protein
MSVNADQRGQIENQTIIVIYDSSYLMSHGPIVSELAMTSKIPAVKRGCEVVHTIPEEVKLELLNHFSNPEKEQKARGARRIIAEIMRTCDLSDHNVRFQEVNLTASVVQYSSDDTLGADSMTDRLLMGYAKTLAESYRYTAVIIATEDGGIMIDVSQLRRATGLSIYYWTKHDGEEHQQPRRAGGRY